eukprot:5039780-Amphidinium_carterae.1
MLQPTLRDGSTWIVNPSSKEITLEGKPVEVPMELKLDMERGALTPESASLTCPVEVAELESPEPEKHDPEDDIEFVGWASHPE